MPIKKQDATRALELLEQYHRRLNAAEDAQLRSAIERVIKIFKSKLFNALIEIQEFYEVTLLDENKSVEQKALETENVADRWSSTPTGVPPSHQPGAAKPKSQKPPSSRRPAESPQSPPPSTAAVVGPEPGPDGAFELVLQRPPGQGFGFSIAGGTDEPHQPGDSRVYVTKVVPGGVADVDGRMRVDDAILAVNGVDVTAVPHEAAVNALKLSGSQLRLLMLRPPASLAPAAAAAAAPDATDSAALADGGGGGAGVEVTLAKSAKGLGFSIAGGVDNQHLPGDDAIFVTKIIEGGAAQLDGRVEFGDRLLAVDGRSLRGCSHQAAVASLKATGDRVRLTVAKATPGEMRTLLELDAAARLEEAEAAAAADAAAGYQGGGPADGSRQGTDWQQTGDAEAPHGAYYPPVGYEEHPQNAAGGSEEKSKKSKGLAGLFGKKKK